MEGFDHMEKIPAEDGGRIMDGDRLARFVEAVGRAELYDELGEIRAASSRKVPMAFRRPPWYPRYLKAVRVTLVSLGYDQQWVEHELRDALEREYLPGRRRLRPGRMDGLSG